MAKGDSLGQMVRWMFAHSRSIRLFIRISGVVNSVLVFFAVLTGAIRPAGGLAVAVTLLFSLGIGYRSDSIFWFPFISLGYGIDTLVAGNLPVALSLLGTSLLWVTYGVIDARRESGLATEHRLLAFGINAVLFVPVLLTEFGTIEAVTVVGAAVLLFVL